MTLPYHVLENGKNQTSTVYTYTLDSYPPESAGIWVYLELYLWDEDPDYDFSPCTIHSVP